ncbi:unnamed protein product [marine sediment metagenome]|uniref:Branched-chain amino acid aminotransferase n=1 Tax=marine sediment metagenome TaxID=412755 RepID=X1C782_9ZZZZ
MRSMNYMPEIHIQLCSEDQKKEKIPDEKLEFGKKFTDHMFLMKYKDGKWGTPKIMPYQNFSLDPAAMVLHYGQEIFEGMKAYINQKTDSVYIFRPHENAKEIEKILSKLKDDLMEIGVVGSILHDISQVCQQLRKTRDEDLPMKSDILESSYEWQEKILK